MLAVYRNMFRIRDLRTKILFTLFIFAVYRLGAAIPVPGVDLDAVDALAEQAEQGGIVGLLNLFSGGALEQLSVFALGILPYITASIIMQLLAVVIPRLQKLQDEGEAGRKVITQWTRYLTVGLAVLQSTGLTFLFHNGGLGGTVADIDLIPQYTAGRVAIIVLSFTAGTALVMWLGELITQRGIGNGMSLIIFISILSQLPSQWTIIRVSSSTLEFLALIVVFAAMTVGIIFVDQGQRRIPIQFSKRVRGRRVLGGQSTYIPLKVNTAGVIPVIFATSVLYFPVLLSTSIPWAGLRNFVDRHIGLSQGQSLIYVGLLFMLVVFFTYFYTAIQFDPVRQAEMIQRQGGFIPGIRPGSQTVRYLEHVLSRITLPGSMFLATVAVLPSFFGWLWNIPIGFSGISVLIVVGVALETMKQIESQLMMRNYEGFLT
jgi:preprotein translocase subunit SecY